MADLISVPLKKPSEIDIVKPLKNLIAASYSTADKPEDYSEAINEFSKLRNNAVWRAFEKYESSLEVIYSYYDQLCALEAKIPAHEIQIPFKWKDAFDRGSIFGGRISLTVSSLSYEKICVLFNIAALQSAVAAARSLDSDEGLKLAAKLFQQAAGIFNHLKAKVMLAIQQDPTPDLNPEVLAGLGSLMLAQAQEMFVLKAMHDQMKPAIIAKLCAQCEEYYSETLKHTQNEQIRALWHKEWFPLIASKQAGYRGLTEYYQSMVCKENKAIGEEISRLEHAIGLLKVAVERSDQPLFWEQTNKATRALEEAKKDNDFIYHERIPDYKSLQPVGKAPVAKATALPARFSQSFKDLFENLVPVMVHQALAAYDVRKSEIVNGEVSKLHEATQTMNSILASLNLPAALEDTSGSSLPPSLVEKSKAVIDLGGAQAVSERITELPVLLQRNKDILDEIERILRQEQEQDDQLRDRFKSWNRVPSKKLTATFHTNITNYRELISNAMKADATITAKFQQHRRGIDLLSSGQTAIEKAVPAASGSGANAQSCSAFKKLKRLMEDVETIKAERETIESELKSATSDMKDTFLSALAQDGAINEPATSVEVLGRVFGPLQRQVQDSLRRQELLLQDIQLQNNDFCKEKTGSGAAAAEREKMFVELAAAHDAYMEITENLKAGMKFYNGLTQQLVGFQNKVMDFCFARKTEVTELMENIAHDSTRLTGDSTDTKAAATQPSVPTQPNVPTQPTPPSSGPSAHGASQGQSVPPPQGYAPPGGQQLPYPTYPQVMPLPFGATSSLPYPSYVPPPMPQGYNPYAGAPYPQPGYGYPIPPQNQQPQYPGYPYQPVPPQHQQQNPPPW